MSDGPTCGQCHFFEAIGAKKLSGACHRFPPTTVVMPDADEPSEIDIKGAVWPILPATQWCGEFRGAN